MRRFRLFGACSTIAIAAALVWRASGQGVLRPRAVIDHFAPPAIENGIRPDVSRAPDSPETRQRLSLRRDSSPADRTGASGRSYVAGRVIVKFRDGASAESRIGALAAASRTARMGNRPSYADFDVVSIDPNEDAEAVATARRR